MKIAIYGYGNLGRGVEAAVAQNPDTSLVGIFTRRAPDSIGCMTDAPVYSARAIADFKGMIDVVVICGGSATDLPIITPTIARDFTVVDSFDTHARIPEHFERVDSAALQGGNVAIISSGWDPGLFSVIRLYSSAILPVGREYTFWGRGISQGHSDAIRRIDGVIDARQYTVPCDEAISRVRGGENPILTARDKHRRECYVVADISADKGRIEEEIKTMPNYFSDYDTTVEFVSLEQLHRDHSCMPHGGSVIRCGASGVNSESMHTLEFSLKLGSNPEFTGGVLIATARAANRMKLLGLVGCKTLFDIPPSYFFDGTDDDIRARFL